MNDFLLGEHEVPAVIWCKDGFVIERDPEMVTIGEIRGVTLDKDYWDAYPSFQKDSCYFSDQGDADSKRLGGGA